jgi:hypothetical protein
LSNITNDGQGRPIIMLTQTSADSTVWVYSERTEITYHPNDTSTGEDFIAYYANLFSMYNLVDMGSIGWSAMVSESTNQYYGVDWINETRYNYTYDAQNRQIEAVERSWDGGWVNSYQTLYTYNASGNPQQSLESMWDGAVWGNQYRYTYTWGDTTVNDDDTNPVIQALCVSAAPNPFAGAVAIRVSTKTAQPVKLSVYNTRGQLIKSFSAQANTSINWDGRDMDNQIVSNGIYFIKADIAGSSKTTKVLKLK